MVQNELYNIFPSSFQYDIANLSEGRAVFLLTVYRTELLRMKASTSVSNEEIHSPLESLFDYLSSSGILQSNLMQFISHIADTAFVTYVEVTKSSLLTSNEKIGESIMRMLLLWSCCRFSTVRSKAIQYINRLATTFPYLQWNSRTIADILDLIQSLYESVQSSESLFTPSSSVSSVVFAKKVLGIEDDSSRSMSIEPDIHAILSDAYSDFQHHCSHLHAPETTLFRNKTLFEKYLPGENHIRKEILESIEGIVSGWLMSAKYLVPSSIVSVLQHYALNLQQNNESSDPDIGHHHGLAIALQATQVEASQSIASIVSALGIKQRYLGEINALYEHYSGKWGVIESNFDDINFSSLNDNKNYSLYSSHHFNTRLSLFNNNGNINSAYSSTSTLHSHQQNQTPFGAMLTQHLKQDYETLIVRYRKEIRNQDQKT